MAAKANIRKKKQTFKRYILLGNGLIKKKKKNKKKKKTQKCSIGDPVQNGLNGSTETKIAGKAKYKIKKKKKNTTLNDIPIARFQNNFKKCSLDDPPLKLLKWLYSAKQNGRQG